MDEKEYAKFCRKATKYVVEADQLFRRAGSGVPLRRVVDDLEQRRQILHMMHDEFGHKGREGTYSTLQARYWWPGMYKDVSAYVKHCSQCQLRDSQRLSEEVHPTWAPICWEKVGVDIKHMPSFPSMPNGIHKGK
ncbi:hypothetical protein CIHG_03769 [Coccidioides immitis H538.4]|uniref:Integrase zinc-binding domain-containing protein n=1 Tax=Coccidioides immitis H538.4 TaxID=396776 RepID=A0A0J8RP14_COCIT|nr:hypothetical protein CIHG_03769 [Coccidioides immitis H538.4]